MATVKKSLTINVPADMIFGYIHNPTNLLEVWPSFVEAKDVQSLPNGGHSFRWTYKMAGMRFEGATEDTEVVANQRIVSKSKGGIDSTITWTFQPEGKGTKVTLEADYTVPIPLLGKLAESVIVKLNEQEAVTILANLKARMEV
jgi:uncharacterized membrane protein